MIKREALFLAGMPNLSLCGLSENWLLKECGNQHWCALATFFGLPTPQFRTAENTPVYAAFVAVELKGLKLHLIQENANFAIETCLVTTGRTRFYSNHKLHLGGQCCAEIGMLSTLVSRKETGNNQSVRRIELKASHSPAIEEGTLQKRKGLKLAENAKLFRSGKWEQWHELQNTQRPTLLNYTFHPCPNNDFNGADFLYFANFQAAADRAEWAWNNNRELWRINDRRLNYYSNINIGDSLHFESCALNIDADQLTHCITVRRNSDGYKIADILTRKIRLKDTRFRWA